MRRAYFEMKSRIKFYSTRSSASHMLSIPHSRSLKPQNYSTLFFIKELVSGMLFQTKLEPNISQI